MSLTFFGFSMHPFSTSPDPRFLYPTRGHREALAQLLYAVQERVGFAVLTGEVGTGKTTLLHALMQQLGETATVAFVGDSRRSLDEIFESMAAAFGIAVSGASRVQRLQALQEFLMERDAAGHTAVLVLDEAQHLDVATLEGIRLLSNLETPDHKLLQIILAGQPELRERLARPELRQLRQRITLWATVPRLTAEQTGEYIRRRLRVAGSADADVFSDRAIALIADHAHGIPRVINVVCRHCLVTAYAERIRRVDVEVVREAIAYIEDASAPRPAQDSSDRARLWARRLAWTAAAPVLFALVMLPARHWNPFAEVSNRVGSLVGSLLHTTCDRLGS